MSLYSSKIKLYIYLRTKFQSFTLVIGIGKFVIKLMHVLIVRLLLKNDKNDNMSTHVVFYKQ